MKVRCDRNELTERLLAIGGIVAATQSTKPILNDFLLVATEDELIVEATDLDISARVHVERVQVEESGRIALPAAKLQSLVREIPTETLALESDGNAGAAGDFGGGASGGASSDERSGTAVRLASEGYEFRLLGDDPAEYPEIKAFESASAFRLPREKFVDMLRRVGIAASRDSGRFQLTGIFFEVEGSRLTMTATDGKRLTNDVLQIDNPENRQISAIVPNRAVDVLTKLLAQGEESIEVAFSSTEIQVSFGFGQLMAKLIEGTYPDYHAAIPKDKKTKVSARRADLLAAVKTAALVTDRETSTVVFRFEENQVFLESRASDVGESKISVPVTFEGEAIEICFNPVYFLDALRTINEEQIRLEFSGPDRPGTLRGGIHYRHMLMPLVA